MYKTSIGALRDSCAAQSIVEMTAPTSDGGSGDGVSKIGAGLSQEWENRPQFVVVPIFNNLILIKKVRRWNQQT
jgi:hypothetical protein